MISAFGRANPRFFKSGIVAVALGVTAALAISCGGSSSSTPANPTPTVASSPAPSNTVWLCRPGLADDPCEGDLTTTVFPADGTSTVEQVSRPTDPAIDCFYVYPTVSNQATTNADLTIDPEEKAVAVQQAARFSQVCKVYAPLYRQLTLLAITTAGLDTQAARDLAYADVISAWQDYMAHYNNGRPFVLIGHSQGTMMLTQLIKSEVDPNSNVRQQLVSALLLGGNVTVPVGQDVGGDFKNIPACRSTSQTGCVLAYSSFNQPPPADTLFGRVGVGPTAGQPANANLHVLCVNPASLSGGTGPLQLEFGTAPFPGIVGQWLQSIPSAATPWAAYPNLYTGHCESSGDLNWLQVDTTNIPGDPRPVVSAKPTAQWGLHLYDVSLALGNLVDLVRQQAAVFAH
jgi:hypothetical protein